jgi:hypothetical protein
MAAPSGASSANPNSQAPGEIPQAAPWQQALILLAAACILTLAAAWNGHPFLYPDTPTYLRGAEMGAHKIVGEGRLPPWIPDGLPPSQSPVEPSNGIAPSGSITSISDKVVLAGRSVYYGALLYLGFLAGSLWLAVLAQGLCVAYVLHLLVVRLWGQRETTFLAGVAALALATPLAVFTGLLMPDVFAGLTILGVATLAAYWARLGRLDRWLLAALLLFALASHGSHVVLAASMLALVLGLRAWRRWRSLSLAGMGVVAACLAGALAAEAAFSKAVTLAVGAPPLRLPHLTARLVDMGPGTDYLRSHCAVSRYAACAYLHNYPTAWDEFLFSTDPAKGAFALADAEGKRRMSQEQLGFALRVLGHDPARVLSGILADVVRQVALFQVDVTGLRSDLMPAYAGRVPDEMFAAMQRSRGMDSEAANVFFTTLTHASVGASLLLAAGVAWRRRRAAPGRPAFDGPASFDDFAVLVLAGVLANAVVCAALAGALERFQSRVIWLVPFIGLAWLALALQRRRSAALVDPAAPDTHPSIPSFERPAP